MKAYTPIDCDFYDRFEAWATLRTELKLNYSDSGAQEQLTDTIIDLFVKDHVEYLRTKSDMVIRLDHIISVEDATGVYTLSGQSCSTK